MAWVLAMLDTIHGNLDENQQPFNFQEASLLITCSFDIARRCPAWPHKDCQRACTKGVPVGMATAGVKSLILPCKDQGPQRPSMV